MDRSYGQENGGRLGLSVITYFSVAASILIFSTGALAADKILSIIPNEIEFFAIKDGANPDAQSIYINNFGTGQLAWEITEDCAWLSVNPSSGECTNMVPSEVAVSIDVSGLVEGVYTYQLQVIAPDAVNSPQYVSVSLVIGAILELSSTSFSFLAFLDGAIPADQVLVIGNAGSGILDWSISEDCDWLSVAPDSGLIGPVDPNSEVVLSVDITGLEEGNYSCELEVSAIDALNSPQVITVNLHIGSGLYVPTPEYPTIQSAINAAVEGDTVIVSEGTYVENINFGGKNIILTSTNPDNMNVVAATIIDGGDMGSVVTFAGTEDSNCVLTGFTITGGARDIPTYIDLQPEGEDVESGWIEWEAFPFEPIILSAGFDNDFSATLDYGISIDNGDWQSQYPPAPEIADVFEDGYRTYGPGDVITLRFSDLNAGDYLIATYHFDMSSAEPLSTFSIIVDDEIIYDDAFTSGRDLWSPDQGVFGFEFTSNGVDDVVIEFDGTVVSPEDNEVWLNGFAIIGWEPLSSGGGIMGNGCTATISKCVVKENRAKDGAGIYDCDGLIENNTIHDNEAQGIQIPRIGAGFIGIGGGLYGCDGTIIKNTISINDAFAGGGLVFCDADIINNPVIGNLAVYGSALYECHGIIRNCSIVANRNVALESCKGTITNCIIWQNHRQFDDCSVPSYCCIENWPGGGEGNIDLEPMFVDNEFWDDNGTPDINWDDFWVGGDYHLQWDSPCVDKGDPNYFAEEGEIDIDGEPRVMGGRVDMGADEVGPKQADFTRDGRIDGADFGVLSQSWQTSVGDENWYVLSDLYEDGVIDLSDLYLLVEDWMWEFN